MADEAQDRREIIELAVAYCRIVDSGDFEMLRDIFTPDATTELGGSGQSGIDQIIGRLSTALGKFDSWEHHIGDHEVTIDGDAATARCSVRAVHQRPFGESPPTDTVVGSYEDRIVRTAHGWRLSKRSLVVQDRF